MPVGVAIPSLDRLAIFRGDRQTRNRNCLASEKLPTVLDMESSTRSARVAFDGGPYLLTLVSPTSMPSFSNSPWMRGTPQSGFSRLIFRFSLRISIDTADGPADRANLSRKSCPDHLVSIDFVTVPTIIPGVLTRIPGTPLAGQRDSGNRDWGTCRTAADCGRRHGQDLFLVANLSVDSRAPPLLRRSVNRTSGLQLNCRSPTSDEICGRHCCFTVSAK